MKEPYQIRDLLRQLETALDEEMNGKSELEHLLMTDNERFKLRERREFVQTLFKWILEEE